MSKAVRNCRKLKGKYGVQVHISLICGNYYYDYYDYYNYYNYYDYDDYDDDDDDDDNDYYYYITLYYTFNTILIQLLLLINCN